MATSDVPIPSMVLSVPRAERLRIGKRVFDVLVASLLVMLLSPVLAVVWLLIRVTSPGSAVFQQIRIGRYSRPFVMYKFRTMFADCPDDVHREYVRKLLTDEPELNGGTTGLYKLDDDPRVTRIGGWLRRFSLDELPQLFNVVRGDMSLVGPRPALPWEAELFSAAHLARFLAAPGVTGLWQASGRNTLTMIEGLELDVEYVRRQSFLLDLLILVKTVPVVLTANGAR